MEESDRDAEQGHFFQEKDSKTAKTKQGARNGSLQLHFEATAVVGVDREPTELENPTEVTGVLKFYLPHELCQQRKQFVDYA